MSDLKSLLFYSDFNCPFCFALNERIILLGDPVSIKWRGIEHMPAANSRNNSWEEQSMIINEVSVVRKRAPEIPLSTPTFRPSTRPANLLVGHFADAGPLKVSQLRTLIYRAYWQENRDISNHEILCELVVKCGLTMPKELDEEKLDLVLKQWQEEWEGERFQTRLPILVDQLEDRPILGFPTYDLLNDFIAGEPFPFVPESFAACELRPKQVILIVSNPESTRCNPKELTVAYEIVHSENLDQAKEWLGNEGCPPDAMIVDIGSLGRSALEFCRSIRQQEQYRKTAILALLDEHSDEAELEAFDSGASDVVFDLSNAKVCQARIEFHLRMQRSSTLLGMLAQLDYLTEVPNKREFERRFEQEWFRGRRSGAELSLLLLDIDFFKPYNDTYGHSQGDDCLRQVARALQSRLHRATDMIARIGGEEFAVLLPETPQAGAERVAEEMCAAVRELELPHEASTIAKTVTISIGFAGMIPGDKMMPQFLAEQADKALYEAKKSGRDRAVRYQEKK